MVGRGLGATAVPPFVVEPDAFIEAAEIPVALVPELFVHVWEQFSRGRGQAVGAALLLYRLTIERTAHGTHAW